VPRLGSRFRSTRRRAGILSAASRIEDALDFLLKPSLAV
jgi:hypothetical protein